MAGKERGGGRGGRRGAGRGVGAARGEGLVRSRARGAERSSRSLFIAASPCPDALRTTPNPRPPPYLHSHELVSTLYTQWPPAQTTVHSELRRAPMSRRRLPRPQTSVASALSAGPLDTCTGPDQTPGIRSTAPDDICAHAQTPSLDTHVDPNCISPQPQPQPQGSRPCPNQAFRATSKDPPRSRPGPRPAPALPRSPPQRGPGFRTLSSHRRQAGRN